MTVMTVLSGWRTSFGWRRCRRTDRLVQAGAWHDAAPALLELELPESKLRRLLYEDGEWFCSLSRQPNLPVDVDDTADAAHEVPALAILSALLEARRRMSDRRDVSSPAVPHVRPASDDAVCCDNFA